MYRFVRILQPVLAVFCLALPRLTVFACEHNATNATNVTEIRTFELGSNVTFCCGNGNLSSSTLLSWSKDENVLVNITSNNTTLVLSNLTAEDSGLFVCTANSTLQLRRVQLNMRTNGEEAEEEEEEEEEIQDGGLTDVDYIAIALGLGLTTFIVISMAVLLYRAEKRLKRAKHMQKWRVTVKGRENMAVEEDVITKPVSRNDFHLKNGPTPGYKRAPPNMRPAEYRWLETLGREYEIDGNQNRTGGAMWRATAYV